MKNKIPQGLKNVYHFLVAFLAALVYRFPARNLKVIGVTGTDGKTTTVNLIYHILEQSEVKVGAISTLGGSVGKERVETGFHVTTPDSFTLQKLLRKFANSGVEYAVLEVTSHGLDQNRVAFIPFQVGLITNVTHEHLDYHKNYRNYLKTKAKILNRVKYRVLNSDDAAFEKLKMAGTGQLVTFGKVGSDYFGEVISDSSDGSDFAIHYRTKQKQLKTLGVQTNLSGEFNLSNILSAFAVAKIVGLEDKKIIAALSTFKGVEGRMDEVKMGQDFRVFIDFAHTPTALEMVLKTLRNKTGKRLICVFGSAGERDRPKRWLMGQFSARLADFSIITSEDPRSESPNKIIEEIVRGFVKEGKVHNRDFWKIPDRSEAISFAVKNLAESGDTVAVLGKGHEKSINIGGKEYPWSDREKVEGAIRERLGV